MPKKWKPKGSVADPVPTDDLLNAVVHRVKIVVGDQSTGNWDAR